MSFYRSARRLCNVFYTSHLVCRTQQFTNSKIPVLAQSLCSFGSRELKMAEGSEVRKSAGDSNTSKDVENLIENTVTVIPKDSWSKETLNLYDELSKLAEQSNGQWEKLENFYYSGKHHSFHGSVDKYGKNFYEYFWVLNKNENRGKSGCQFGPSTMGPRGFVHGGAIAGFFDVVTAGLTNRCGYKSLTANLSVDFKQPIPMESTVLCEVHIESVQGRKVYSYAEMRSHDGLQLYATAKCLCVTFDGKK